MPWNGSGVKKYTNKKQNNTNIKNKHSSVYLFSACIILLVLSLVVFLFQNKNHESIVKSKNEYLTKVVRHNKIKRANKAIHPSTNTAPVSIKQDKEEPPKQTLHDRLAKRKFGVGNRVDTNAIKRVKAPYEIFKRRSENHLAFLVSVPYGATVVGGMKYTERFMKDLEASLEEKIEIEDTDTYEEKLLKASVIEVKEELLKRKRSGEDLRVVLKETYQEIQKLGVIKQDLEKEVRKIVRDASIPNEDVEILIREANRMLEEKGISPIQYNSLTRKVVREKTFNQLKAKENE